MSAALRASSKALRPSARLSARPCSRSYATSSSSQLLADSKADEFHNLYKGTATNGGETKLYIDGQFESSQTKDWIELHDPVRRALLIPRIIVDNLHSESMHYCRPLKEYSQKSQDQLSLK